MSDEQRVRSALEYDLDPYTPNAGDLMRRGKRLAWVRRGLAAAGVTALAGTVATVSAAVGGPAQVKNLFAGAPKAPPVAVPLDTPKPSVDPTCLPGKPNVPAKPKLPVVKVNKTIDPNQQPSVPTTKPNLPSKPSLPTTKPTLPGKPSIPTTKPSLPGGTPSFPTTKPSLPGKPTLPTTKPSLPGKPTLPTTKPTLPGKPTLPTSKPSLPGKPTLPPVPTTKPTLPGKPSLPDCVHGVPTTAPSLPSKPGKPSLPAPKPNAPKPAVPTVKVSGGVKVTVEPGKYPNGKPSIPTTKPTFPTPKPSVPKPSFPTTFPTGHPSSGR